MDLEGIFLSEINQIKKDKYCMISLICGIFQKRNKEKKSSYMEKTGRAIGRSWGFGKLGERIQKLQTSSYKSWGCNVLHSDSSNTVLHIESSKESIKGSYHKKKIVCTYVWCWISTRHCNVHFAVFYIYIYIYIYKISTPKAKTVLSLNFKKKPIFYNIISKLSL